MGWLVVMRITRAAISDGFNGASRRSGGLAVGSDY
jgi:hypothetical protein